MKKICIALGCFLLVMLLAFTGTAHSGRTDGNGGHYDRSTGEYHYHHGEPAHQHEDGMCPYDTWGYWLAGGLGVSVFVVFFVIVFKK